MYYIKEHLHRMKSHSSQTLSLSKQSTTTTTTTTRRQEDEENERGIIHVIKTMSFVTILIVYILYLCKKKDG